MHNKRILLITLRADIGGGPRHVDSIYQNLQKTFDIFIASPVENPFGIKWNNQLAESNHFLKLPHRKFLIKDFLIFVSFVKGKKINIIHAHGRGAGIYARLLKIFLPKLKVIYTLHGFLIESFPFWRKQVAIFIERFLNLFTTIFVNISKNERALCVKNKIYGEEKSVVIYNGIMDEFFEGNNKNVIREKLGLPQDKFIAISITRFDPIKNVKAFVQIADLLKTEDSIFFVLIGDGEEMENIKALIKENHLKNILLTGFVNKPIDYLMSSDIYLSTSISEGLPYSVIEALMCGKPVIASNVIGNNELVFEEYNGFLFELSALSNAADKILRLKNDFNLYKSLSANSRKRYIDYFTEDKMILQLKSLYERFSE